MASTPEWGPLTVFNKGEVPF
uniref:Uncharacterized protein n=1 Tax=Salix viminalis TaxID=40686 RepID=A0A6N2NFM5_SALVM